MKAVAKAVTAALVAGYAIYQVATASGSPGGEALVVSEWVNIAVTGVVAGFAVWLVPNDTTGGSE